MSNEFFSNIEGNTAQDFIDNYQKLLTDTRYTLLSLNKKLEQFQKCMNNALILNTNQPFNEPEEEEELNYQLTEKDLDFIRDAYLENNNEINNKPNIEENKKKNVSNKKHRNTKNKKRVSLSSSEDLDKDSFIYETQVKKKKKTKDNNKPRIKVCYDKKVTKFSEFLKMKKMEKEGKKDDDNINNNNNTIDKNVEESNKLLSNANKPVNPKENSKENNDDEAVLDFSNYGLEDINKYIDKLEQITEQHKQIDSFIGVKRNQVLND